MSKFGFYLSYKDCCILKHALRDQISIKEDVLSDFDGLKNINDEELTENDVYLGDNFDRDKVVKEIEEEKRTLERFTEQIENEKENNHMKAR